MKTKQRTKNSIKKKYQVRNWSAYNQSLKQRGSVAVYLPKNLETVWYAAGKGRSSDTAIEFCLTVSILYRLPRRQTQGFVEDIFTQCGIDIAVPGYSHTYTTESLLVGESSRHQLYFLD